MLSQADLQIALAFALREFGPAWKIVSDCSPVDPLDPTHWASGAQSFHVTLRHRMTGQLKALGRRVPGEPGASYRGLALSLIEAYGHGNAEPLRRYLEEVGVTAGPPREAAAQFFRRPESATAATSSAASADEAALVTEPAESLTEPIPVVSRSADAVRPAVRSRAPSFEGRSGAGQPKRRWRREAPAMSPTMAPPRNRVFSRLRRELVIWQWRRAVTSDRRKTAETE